MLGLSGSRAVDWISKLFPPWHLHNDLDRTDQLLREFVEKVLGGRIHIGGTDVDACFMNMPHDLMWAALRFARECIAAADNFPSIAAPRKGLVGNCNSSFLASQVQGAVLMLEIAHIEALISHELAAGWVKFGIMIGRQQNGLPMGSQSCGALARLGLVYCDVCFYVS